MCRAWWHVVASALQHMFIEYKNVYNSMNNVKYEVIIKWTTYQVILDEIGVIV